MAFRIVVEGDVAWITGTTDSGLIDEGCKGARTHLLDTTCGGLIKVKLQPPRRQLTSWAGADKRRSRYHLVLATFSMPRGTPM